MHSHVGGRNPSSAGAYDVQSSVGRKRRRQTAADTLTVGTMVDSQRHPSRAHFQLESVGADCSIVDPQKIQTA